jgi:hypothetical protein
MTMIEVPIWSFAVLCVNAAATVILATFLVWFNREIDNDRKD